MSEQSLPETERKERMNRIGGVLVLLLTVVVAFGTFSMSVASQSTLTRSDDERVVKHDEDDVQLAAIEDDDDDLDDRGNLAGTNTRNTRGTNDNTGTANTGRNAGTNTRNTRGTNDNTGTSNTAG
jgi:hypothetical protein